MTPTEELIKTSDNLSRVLKGNFIGLQESCRIFNTTPTESEMLNRASFSVSQHVIDLCTKEDFFLAVIPSGVKVRNFFSETMFQIDLPPLDARRFKETSVKPGYYLVKRTPRSLTINGICFIESGMAKVGYPVLSEIASLYFLSSAFKRKCLIQKFCTLCADEILRRGEKKHIVFSSDGKLAEISIQKTNFPAMATLPAYRIY